ncbi:uncharacterized protein LOC111715193 isoform X2 [Eurytemora carolleeae]|uniref:uncharacterized protein LOC111715193 isoform X2 n=1 Tax=Eurytemora carolleeae TaxID=1294199 RepID=UPI000C758663|nr:uncharacterized protein LOC111715193 isoform X2 [Eurytemora carolleeae]XP_023346269.1 uncharacterized protein LOC111715193 isoform X2 [Eurytemora carolleeae]|eukprot:XP_023346261.1 uncharacterized protein LOC111715193 isoform X2 [Eurytemora affinis]
MSKKDITIHVRVILCRYRKCQNVGMKTGLILSDEQKKIWFKKKLKRIGSDTSVVPMLHHRSHIPSKVKTNLNLKSGIAAFFTDLATYRSNNPSSSSHLSLKQNLKSTPTVLSSIPTPVICTTYSAKCSPRAYQNTETVIRSLKIYPTVTGNNPVHTHLNLELQGSQRSVLMMKIHDQDLSKVCNSDTTLENRSDQHKIFWNMF